MRHGLLILLGGHGDDVGLHDILHPGVLARHDDAAQGDHAQQVPALVDDIAVVDRLLIHARAADGGDCVGGGHLRPQGHKLDGHDGAGAVLGIAQQLVDALAHIRVGLSQQTLDHVGRHLLHQVYRVVHVQFVQHRFQLGIRKAADQLFLHIGLHLHKGLGGLLLGQQAEQRSGRVIRHHGEQRRHLRGLHGNQHVAQGIVFFVFPQFFHCGFKGVIDLRHF